MHSIYEKLKTKWFEPLSKLKKCEFDHWIPFSLYGSGMGASLGSRNQNLEPSSDIGSVQSGRTSDFGLRTYDAKSDFTAFLFYSRLPGVITFLSSDSEFAHSFGSIGYFQTFRTIVCRVTARFRSFCLKRTKPEQSPICLTGDLPRKADRTVIRDTEVREVRKTPYRPQLLRRSRIWTPRNREL